MKLKLYHLSLLMFILITGIFLTSCGKKKAIEPHEIIIARIGEKSISVNEFIRRAEYTIRPPYCSSENYIHKKIVLNSLIAEKLLALEINEDNELTRNEEFQAFIRGRKEQAMRQWLYNNVAVRKVKLDTSEIKDNFKLAGREYKVFYLSIKDSTKVNQFKNELTNESFDKLFRKHFGMDEIPTKEIRWDSQNEEIIQDALFSESLEKGQVIGPVKAGDGNYLLMQVAGWTDKPVISDTDMKQRWNDVKEKLTEKQVGKIYRAYTASVMKGKKVEFASDTFFKLTEIVAPHYLKSEEEKKDAFNKRFWKDEVATEKIGGNIDEIKNHSLLNLNGETWTVNDFMKELRVHPLVFRKRIMNKKEFPEQFKLAIVDMIRDKFLTEEAYKKEYDKVNVVKRNAEMWQDNLNSLYQKNKYLESMTADSKNYLNDINLYLNSYVDSLQAKYNDVIEINTDEFEKIELTRIDMFVLQKNVPFPMMVPGFPLLTTDNRLDYGRKSSE